MTKQENHATFMARFGNRTQKDQNRVELAYILAKDAHRSLARKTGERYFEHPRAVALVLFDELDITNPDYICAGLLHDTIEDTRYLNEGFIGQFFGTEVARTVDLLTKHPGYSLDDYFDKLGKDPFASIVKGADRLSNLRTIEGCGDAFIAKQFKETREYVTPMLRKHRDGYPQAIELVELIEKELA